MPRPEAEPEERGCLGTRLLQKCIINLSLTMSEKSDGEQEPVEKQPTAAMAAAVSAEKEEQSLSDDPAEIARREKNKKYFAALSCEEVRCSVGYLQYGIFSRSPHI